MNEIVPERPSKGNIGRQNRLQTALLLLLVVLVGVASFGLGRLSATEAREGGLIIHPAGENN